MKTILVMILLALAVSCQAQIVPVPIPPSAGDTIYIDLTPYLTDYVQQSQMGNYVTEAELNGSLAGLATVQYVDSEIAQVEAGVPDSVVTFQHLIDYYSFTLHDSVKFMKAKTILNYVSAYGDTIDIRVIDNADSTYYPIYYGDWKNFGAWFHNNVIPVFPPDAPEGYYNWGQLAIPPECEQDTVIIYPR